jgi:hypothetical protein
MLLRQEKVYAPSDSLKAILLDIGGVRLTPLIDITVASFPYSINNSRLENKIISLLHRKRALSSKEPLISKEEREKKQ